MNSFLNFIFSNIFDELNVLVVINILLIDLSRSYLFIIGITLNISPTLDP